MQTSTKRRVEWFFTFVIVAGLVGGLMYLFQSDTKLTPIPRPEKVMITSNTLAKLSKMKKDDLIKLQDGSLLVVVTNSGSEFRLLSEQGSRITWKVYSGADQEWFDGPRVTEIVQHDTSPDLHARTIGEFTNRLKGTPR